MTIAEIETNLTGIYKPAIEERGDDFKLTWHIAGKKRGLLIPKVFSQPFPWFWLKSGIDKAHASTANP